MAAVKLAFTVGGTEAATDLFGLLEWAPQVPLGAQVLDRGIVLIDLAIAQIAGLGVGMNREPRLPYANASQVQKGPGSGSFASSGEAAGRARSGAAGAGLTVTLTEVAGAAATTVRRNGSGKGMSRTRFRNWMLPANVAATTRIAAMPRATLARVRPRTPDQVGLGW